MHSQNPNRKHSTEHLFEAIDLDEYDSLHPKKKEVVKMILSVEYADMTVGGKTLETLFEYFPEGTVTRENLNELIAGL